MEPLDWPMACFVAKKEMANTGAQFFFFILGYGNLNNEFETRKNLKLYIKHADACSITR